MSFKNGNKVDSRLLNIFKLRVLERERDTQKLAEKITDQASEEGSSSDRHPVEDDNDSPNATFIHDIPLAALCERTHSVADIEGAERKSPKKKKTITIRIPLDAKNSHELS